MRKLDRRSLLMLTAGGAAGLAGCSGLLEDDQQEVGSETEPMSETNDGSPEPTDTPTPEPAPGHERGEFYRALRTSLEAARVIFDQQNRVSESASTGLADGLPALTDEPVASYHPRTDEHEGILPNVETPTLVEQTVSLAQSLYEDETILQPSSLENAWSQTTAGEVGRYYETLGRNYPGGENEPTTPLFEALISALEGAESGQSAETIEPLFESAWAVTGIVRGTVWPRFDASSDSARIFGYGLRVLDHVALILIEAERAWRGGRDPGVSGEVTYRDAVTRGTGFLPDLDSARLSNQHVSVELGAKPAQLVVDGGTLFARDGSRLYAADPVSGNVAWDTSSGNQVTDMAVTDDALILVSEIQDQTEMVSFARSDGSIQWRQQLSASSFRHRVVVDGGTVYVGHANGLLGLDTGDGSVVLEWETGNVLDPGYAIFDGTLVSQMVVPSSIMRADPYVMGFDLGAGEEIWRNDTNGNERQVGIRDGVAYVTSSQTNGSEPVYGIGLESGEIEWEWGGFGQTEGDAIVTEESLIIGQTSTIGAVDLDSGDVRWKISLPDNILVPVQAAGDTVYATGGYDRAYHFAFDRETGALKGMYRYGGDGPYAYGDGILYAGTGSGVIGLV